MEEIFVGRYLGGGFENDCFMVVDGHGQEIGEVVQILNSRGKLWQHEDAAYLQKCLSLLRTKTSLSAGEDVRVLENVVLIMPGGIRKFTRTVRMTKFEEGFDDLIIKYRDIKEGGVPMLRRIMDVVKDGYYLRENHQLGLDPMGADLVMDVLKGIPQYLVLNIVESLPISLRSLIAFQIRGIEGRARNIISGSDGLECKDIGMQDLSPNGKLNWLMRQYNSFTFAGLIELVRLLNEQLEKVGRKFVPWKEIDSLPCKAGRMHKLVAKKLIKMMISLFEAYDEASTAIRTEFVKGMN